MWEGRLRIAVGAVPLGAKRGVRGFSATGRGPARVRLGDNDSTSRTSTGQEFTPLRPFSNSSIFKFGPFSSLENREVLHRSSKGRSKSRSHLTLLPNLTVHTMQNQYLDILSKI